MFLKIISNCNTKSVFAWFIYVLTVAVALLIFKNNTYQTALPFYLSAETQYNIGKPILYSISEVQLFRRLANSNPSEYNREKGAFHFTDKHDQISNNELQYAFGNSISHGFIYYIKLSKALFFYLGDMDSVIAMNSFLHVIATIFLIKQFSNIWLRGGVLILYGANPLIVHLATYPFYYYPQVISSISALFLLRNTLISNLKIIVAISLIMFAIMIRPSLLFVLFFILIYLYIRDRKNIYIWMFMVSTVLLVMMKLTIASSYSPWFTAYVGVGAYDNSYGIELSDNSAQNYIDEQLNNSSIEKQLVSDNDILKRRYLDILFNDTYLIINNAARNIFELFGYGYRVGNLFLTNISCLIGVITIFIFLRYKLYFLLGVIFFQNIGYIFYYPPIPAYMAGSYLLLLFGWLYVISSWKICNETGKLKLL